MKTKSVAILVVLFVLIALACFLLVYYQVFQKNINLGLDLRGGIHVVLEAVDTPEAPVKPDSIDRVKAIIGLMKPVLKSQLSKKKGIEGWLLSLPELKMPKRHWTL
jgi:preprotein translocase subunit SecD